MLVLKALSTAVFCGLAANAQMVNDMPRGYTAGCNIHRPPSEVVSTYSDILEKLKQSLSDCSVDPRALYWNGLEHPTCHTSELDAQWECLCDHDLVKHLHAYEYCYSRIYRRLVRRKYLFLLPPMLVGILAARRSFNSYRSALDSFQGRCYPPPIHGLDFTTFLKTIVSPEDGNSTDLPIFNGVIFAVGWVINETISSAYNDKLPIMNGASEIWADISLLFDFWSRLEVWILNQRSDNSDTLYFPLPNQSISILHELNQIGLDIRKETVFKIPPSKARQV
ncbi:hypothetical protein NA57DRAFT_74011 [Rhizodiscina lignyota]|uniref:Uncharacterized protein n=1 Tax=Rhizodiscina lignyota TaxID=1504668 RepID=A0A9P4IJE6_9PEZI|nr:hypothetical protein NA57DRAFT_74011 [Rhizodiscina lignyota]